MDEKVEGRPMHRNLPSASGSRLNMRLWIPGTEVVEGWRYRLW